MPISFIDSTNIRANNTSPFDLTLPTCVEGDLVIVAVGGATYSDMSIGVLTGGYTEIADLYASDSRDANLSVSWKIMGEVPDTVISIQGITGGSTYYTLAIAEVWRGVDPLSPLDVTSTTASGIDSAIPDGAGITPVTLGAEVLVVGLGTSADTSITPPTGYSNAVSAVNPNGVYSTLATASKTWSGSGEEDPAAWTNWSTSTGDSWAAVSIALKPDPVIVFNSGEFLISGSASTVVISRVLELSPGALDVTGDAAELVFVDITDFIISVDTLGYTVEGFDPLLTYGALYIPGSGVPITDILGPVITDFGGDPITSLSDYVLDAALRTFLVTGSSAQLFRPGVAYSLVASPGVESIIGSSATIVRKYVPSTSVAEFTTSGSPAELLAVGVTPLLLYANPGEMSVVGAPTPLVVERLAEFETESHNTSGINAILTKAGILQAESGELVVSGTSVAASGTAFMEAFGAYVEVVGSEADLTLTTVWDLFAAPGSYLTTGAELSVVWPYELNALSETYLVSGSLMYITRSTDISRGNRYHLKDVTPRRNIKVIDSGRQAKDVTPIRILELV